MRVFIFGFLGGLFAELLGIYKLRTQAPKALPVYLKSYFYWAVSVGMMVAGGVVAYIYSASGIEIKPILALNVGASAPLIIGAFTQTSPAKIK